MSVVNFALLRLTKKNQTVIMIHIKLNFSLKNNSQARIQEKMNFFEISRFPDFIQYLPDFSQCFPDFS